MADPHPLDALLSEEEADTIKLVEGAAQTSESDATEDAPPEGETEVKPESTETELPVGEPPVETPPERPAETPPVEPEKTEEPPPVAAEPEKRPAGKPSTMFKQLRELRKQVEERDRRLAELERPKPAETQPADDEFEDPLTKLERQRAEDKRLADERLNQLEQRTQQNERQTQQQQITVEIQRQESDFVREHPDYNEALNHLVKTRREEYDETGALDNRAEWWLTHHPQVIERFANERNMAFETDDDVHAAAREASFAVLIEQERMQIITDVRARGKNVAEAVYSLATKRGWQAPSAAPATPAAQAETAQERVQRAKAAEPAATSLSAMQSGAQPVELKITSRAQLLALDEKDLDRYVDMMDAKDPGWDKKLL
jgi:DNA repair exonuclease SbcCD ATPase subunit